LERLIIELALTIARCNSLARSNARAPETLDENL
jgi:hypothetical protein